MKPIYSCKTCKLCKKKIQVNHGIFLHFATDCLLDLNIYGGLDVLEEVLPNEERSERI